MLKKHLIGLLGLLLFGCQAIGMNYARPVVFPLAVLASNFWIDSRLQAEASHNKQAQVQDAPKLGLSRDHDIKGEHAAGVFQRCGFTSAVCDDGQGGVSKCSFSLAQSGYFSKKPEFLSHPEFKKVELEFVKCAPCIMPALFGEKDGAVIVKHLPSIISWYRASEVLASAGRYLKSWFV